MEPFELSKAQKLVLDVTMKRIADLSRRGSEMLARHEQEKSAYENRRDELIGMLNGCAGEFAAELGMDTTKTIDYNPTAGCLFYVEEEENDATQEYPHSEVPKPDKGES